MSIGGMKDSKTKVEESTLLPFTDVRADENCFSFLWRESIFLEKDFSSWNQAHSEEEETQYSGMDLLYLCFF